MTKKKKKTYLEAFAELREIVGGDYDDVDDVVGYVNALRHGEDNAQQSVHLTRGSVAENSSSENQK